MTPESDRADAVDKPIVFVGQMGVGKSTLGRLLASALDRPFVDSDEYIRRATGRNAREVAESVGVEDLHDLELEALADALTTDGVVVAAAASVIDSERGRIRLDERICAKPSPTVHALVYRPQIPQFFNFGANDRANRRSV